MAPTVVQGTVVQSGGGNNNGDDNAEGTKCNDIAFAVLGYANFIAIVIVAAVYGNNAFSTNGSGTDVRTYDGYIYAVLITGIMSLILSGLGMLILMKFPKFIIKAALIFVIALGLLIALLAFATGNLVGGILGLVFFAIGLCYARAAWPRIPFASVNLTTAIDAIRANFGVVVFSYVFALSGFFWVLVWAIAFVGSLEATNGCDDDEVNCNAEPNAGFSFVLLLSFFFGQQILQNSIHVQIAGVTATWWISPEENGFCGSAVVNSFIRTMTTSFGSICFGSLLVAIIQTLKAMARQAQEDGGIGACIAVCILGCLESLLEYFNKWAFIYVGIYGYSYLKAGKSVFELFRNRGWEAIIADDLVGNALFLVSFLVGLFMGAIAVAIEASSDLFDDAGGSAAAISFLLGFLVGFVISSILNSTFGSGVNAVIVLFADCPNEFQRNHPEHHRKMSETWREIYPAEFH
eukprot:CAMPEP_0119548402 /NCGR_PEP_ID=MMETSP1352-20130426/2333_1 /TAXON_ID=265584 /ORGANISM="Stauroneis constricta, Strain CCMP1120" /LENGTH=462 /DNA_ID=CAMNT_0007593665 /DNA_START=164 /DNA_END=1552 /DNA_ORIENTATION=+